MRKTKLLLLLLPLLLLHACSGGEPPEIIPTDAVVTPVQDGVTRWGRFSTTLKSLQPMNRK